MIEMIVFDMAGTVVDEQNIVYRSLHQTLFQSGVDLEFETVLLHGAGKEKRRAIFDLLTVAEVDPEPAMVDDLYHSFKEHLAYKYDHFEIRPYPGTLETFEELRRRGIFIVLNTGFDSAIARMILHEMNWTEGREFDYLVTATDVSVGRPAPFMIEKAMLHFGIESPDHIMKVGDSVIDIEEGQQANCRYVVGITTGAHTREQLLQARPTHVIDHIAEVLDILDDPANDPV
jgi:phosphonatase-like hydrolase